MSEAEQRGPARNQGGEGESPSRELAAFHLSIHAARGANGKTAWETRAYHEESDTAMAWPGPPGEALLAWLRQVAELPGEPEGPGDDFTQIVGIGAATAERLRRAGIRTYTQLAASSAEELGALLELPPERIARRGWITRARALARLASLPTTAPQPAPQVSPPALMIELQLDEEGEIVEQQLTRAGELVPPMAPPAEDRVARLVLEPATLLAAAGANGPRGLPSEVELHLDELALEALAERDQSGIPQLRASATLAVAGLGAELLLRASPAYLAFVLGYELATGETVVLQGTGGQLGPAEREQPIALSFVLPPVGRYQILLVAVLADWATMCSAAGPRLQVTP